MTTVASYIQTDDLVKVYRLGDVEVQALRGLSIKIDQGEVISIVGPSGSGKTTLLNIIGGLTYATAGKSYVAGYDISSSSPAQLGYLRQKIVGHIFQTLNLIPTLTAYENVELPMLAINAPKNERKKRVTMLLDQVGLGLRMNHKPDELSGGEKQRVAIAAALANDPPILIADEPTGDLDTETGARIVEFLLSVNKDMGKTVLIVTHDPQIARQTDRIYRIMDGRIISVQTPGEAEEATVEIRIQMYRDRLTETNDEIAQLQKAYEQQRVTAGTFAERWTNLHLTKDFLEKELNRMGL
ncbi:MAG: ABC transporter ATP-binding protein [Candidatus Thorarchaeota archaeon]|nr:MAG: ABC transporter ATP-binding protein [Candidatus Thorarchaeota archaeon]